MSQVELSGSEIRTLRKSLHMTQAQFAVHLHVAPATVVRWEREISVPQPAARAVLKALGKQGEEIVPVVEPLPIVTGKQ